MLKIVYERECSAVRTYTDAQIDYWGEVFTANPQIARRGVLFEVFLFNPPMYLGPNPAVSVFVRDGLLQEQRAVRRSIDQESALQEMAERAIEALAAESRCTNGKWIEKLRHHAWPPRRWANRKLMEVSDGN